LYWWLRVLLGGTRTIAQIVPDIFFIYNVGYLCRVAKEVEISTNGSFPAGVACNISTKGVVIEVIVGFLELVAKPVVGILKVNTLGV
jgi:hypothetical protein